jgi:pimeloyl-ACP methyl ester carboxylesterase
VLAEVMRGEGPRPVVLLHGFLGSSRNLSMIVRAWQERSSEHRFLSLDLPGHGRSPPLPADGDLDHMADQVWRAMRARDCEEALVVGHSLGARVGLAMVRRQHPLRRLAMLDMTPGPLGPTETQSVLDVLLQAPARAASREAMLQHLSALPPALADWLSMNLERTPNGVQWRFDRDALVRFHLQHIEEDLWDTAAVAADRIHVLVGGRSSYVPVPDATRMGELGIDVQRLDQAGHFVHVDALEPVVAWLQGVENRSG